MGGPHRNHGYTALCRAVDQRGSGAPCRSPADGACLRCGVPLCHEHWPGKDARCDACETEFEHTAPTGRALRRVESRVVTMGGATLGLAVSLLSSLDLAWTLGLVATTVVSGHWFRMMTHLSSPGRGGLSPWLLRGRRTRFLRERALPAGRTHNRLT